MATDLGEVLWAARERGWVSAGTDHPRAVDKLRVMVGLVVGLAGLSTCRRRRVGAVLVTPDLSSILSVGYNGPPAGSDNGSCSGAEGSCGCCHAEANALVKLGGEAPGLVMLSTDAPCPHCAGLMANSGRVDWVVFGRPYRDPVGLGVLDRAGVRWVAWSRLEA